MIHGKTYLHRYVLPCFATYEKQLQSADTHPSTVTDVLDLRQIAHITITVEKPQLKPEWTVLSHGCRQRLSAGWLPALTI